MGRSAAGRHFAGLSGWYRGLPRSRTRLLKAVLFAVSLLILVWPRFDAALDSAERYRGIQTQDEWDATAVWLGVAACARQTGSWLMMCEAPGKLVPMSADDPGHAFLLGLWSQLAGRDATFLDVARLNLGVNAVGLVMLAGALAILGAFTGSIVVLALGPVVYFSWFGVSPHWAVIGVASMQVVLPLAILARHRDWLPPAVANAMTIVGLAALALASLIREVAGSMGLLMTLLTIGWLLFPRHRARRPIAGLVLLGVLTVLASQSARIVVAARDMVYAVDTTQLVSTHGMSHTLFVGLGSVENKFGLVYNDQTGWKAASEAVPGIEYFSKDYFILMRKLYFQKWAEDPLEVVRIYLVKLRLALTDDVLHDAPPLWLFLVACLGIHFLASGRALTDGTEQGDKLLALNLVMLGFIGLFVGQAVLAHLSRLYAAPTGTFMVAMMGIAVENLRRWAWRRWSTTLGVGAGGPHSP